MQRSDYHRAWHSLWRGWIKPLVVVIVVISTFRSAVADWNDVPTQSMEPNILVGDRIFVNKLAYDLRVPFTTWRIGRWSDPQPGDAEGRKKLQDLEAACYAASGKSKPAKASAITYILVHERKQGLISN